MTDWLQQLAQQREKVNPADAASGDFFALLDHLGHISFSGDDAAHFLHNQLTNDVEHLGPDHVRLAGYCSPKGRLLASLLVWREPENIIMQLPRELQAGIQKRLQMYVLRAKVKLHDATADTVVFGLVGDTAAAVLQRWFTALPMACFDKIDNAFGNLMRLRDAEGKMRWQWRMSAVIAAEVAPTLCAQMSHADASRWRLTDIHAAMPMITAATQEKFVPQMINFEAIGGVDFKKGCYPGQEIVARSQYLGKLKRRMLPASIDAEVAEAGMEVFSNTDAQQPCGMIVNAERGGDQRTYCLVELKLAALEADSIHLGVAGPALKFAALPYGLPDAD